MEIFITDPERNQPRVIELVGPPGVGKTTLVKTLQKHDMSIQVELPPYFRRVKFVPFFINNLIAISPFLLHLFIHNKAWLVSKRDVAFISILSGWHHSIEKILVPNKIVLLEEGAVCLLAKLLGFGSSILREPIAASWWKDIYGKWARTLDLLIVLDAPVPVLVKRIRNRKIQYEFANMTDLEAGRYLSLIKQHQRRAIRALGLELGGPKIIHFDTSELDSITIAIEVLKSLN